MMLASTGAPASPGMTRLDRVLELVTDHEARYREQDMRIADVVRKMADMETRFAVELDQLWPLKERNVGKELDMARTAVEAVVRQMAAVNRTNQAVQADLKSAAYKHEQWQLATDAVLASLQLDVEQLKRGWADTQANTRQVVEQLRTSVGLQMEAHRQEMQEQLQAMLREVRAEMSSVRSDTAASTSDAVREVEGWARGEMLSLTGKLKSVVQSCAAQQEQATLQMEALQQQWDNTQTQVEALQQEDRRIKKHVVKLQNQNEELQRVGQQAIASEVAMQQLKNDIQQLHAATQAHSARLEVMSSSSSGLSHQLREAGQKLQHMEATVVGQSKDLTLLAENVGSCLQAARDEQVNNPQSYLSSLLAPASTSYGGTASAPQRHKTAWDDRLHEFDDLVMRLRKRLQSNEQQRLRLWEASNSPARHPPSPNVRQRPETRF